MNVCELITPTQKVASAGVEGPLAPAAPAAPITTLARRLTAIIQLMMDPRRSTSLPRWPSPQDKGDAHGQRINLEERRWVALATSPGTVTSGEQYFCAGLATQRVV